MKANNIIHIRELTVANISPNFVITQRRYLAGRNLTSPQESEPAGEYPLFADYILFLDGGAFMTSRRGGVGLGVGSYCQET